LGTPGRKTGTWTMGISGDEQFMIVLYCCKYNIDLSFEI
jgi:hypothetical protein